MSIKRQFAKFVSQNILGMMGVSCYILADSYFISRAQGANGLTALNLVLPIYNIIFAIGSMIGIGSAIRYAVARTRDPREAEKYLFNAIVFTVLIGLVIAVIGVVFTDQILTILGADAVILSTGRSYTKIFISFSPIFMLNYVANAYVRNDGNPTTAMLATLLSSLFNIAFDYILMFPLGMGMPGAALATALSPVLGIGICCTHLFSKKSQVRCRICMPSLKRLFASCQVGVSAFVGEISSGVITLVFNYLILMLAGNVGVAAFGVVANISLVAVAVFNGIAQGSQPLISDCYGRGRLQEVKTLRNMSFMLAMILAVAIYLVLALGAVPIVAVFNGEQNEMLAYYGVTGMRLYFLGILFAGLNIVGSSFFSATEEVRSSFWISILRGFVLIVAAAFVMAFLFGMNGVWLSYMTAELLTAIVMLLFLRRAGRRNTGAGLGEFPSCGKRRGSCKPFFFSASEKFR